VLPRLRHFAHCWLTNQQLKLFLYISSRDSQGQLRFKEP
jgi:hypothetical protein